MSTIQIVNILIGLMVSFPSVKGELQIVNFMARNEKGSFYFDVSEFDYNLEKGVHIADAENFKAEYYPINEDNPYGTNLFVSVGLGYLIGCATVRSEAQAAEVATILAKRYRANFCQ